MEESDHQLFSFTDEENPPSPEDRVLKRLKRTAGDEKSNDGLSNEAFSLREDSSEPSPKAFDDSEPTEQLEFLSREYSAPTTNHPKSDAHSSIIAEGRAGVKRMLQFDSLDDTDTEEANDPVQGIGEEPSYLKPNLHEESHKSEEKNPKKTSEGPKACLSTKRNPEKERAVYLRQLHADSQKILRETQHAQFRPAPPAHKPISSVLEKIRKRKLDLLKNHCQDTETSESAVIHDTDFKENGIKEVNTGPTEAKSNAPADAERESNDNLSQLNEASTFQHKQEGSLLGGEEEEVLAPSLLAMNLKLTSNKCSDDSDGDDDYNDGDSSDDKENIAPPDQHTKEAGDPVKAFVDDEAEQDDSDDDGPFGSEETEDDDDDEPDDLIATGYEENDVDSERRNQLHQQWLEQKDAAGTEDILQRLRCGDGATGHDTANGVRSRRRRRQRTIHSMKVEQMIRQQPFGGDEGDGAFMSSDDDDDAVLRKVEGRRRVLGAAPVQSSVADDESSREVFGLIKKLNVVVSNPKKKSKVSSCSFFDAVLSADALSSRSSFVGRVSSVSSLSCKRSSSVARSFVFGRDDSRDAEEDSTAVEEVENEAREGKLRRRQRSGNSKQVSKGEMGGGDGSSLLHLLRRSSINSIESSSNLSEDVFLAFKSSRKSSL